MFMVKAAQCGATHLEIEKTQTQKDRQTDKQTYRQTHLQCNVAVVGIWSKWFNIKERCFGTDINLL